MPITPEEQALIERLKQEMIARGYRWEVHADGTEERVIRPDGSVAVVARKPLKPVEG